MSLILKVDDFIMRNVFERFAWWTQARFTVNNFQLARYVLALSNVAHWGHAIMVSRPFWIPTLITVIAVLLFLMSFRTERQAKRGFTNWQRNDPVSAFFRLFLAINPVLFIIAPILTPGWVKQLDLTGLWLFYGFVACNPIPPGYEEEKRERVTAPQVQ